MSGDLYDKAIKELAQAASPCRLSEPDRTVRLDNPLCGDRVTLDLKLEGDRILQVGFAVRACLLTRASTVLLARWAPQQPVDVAGRIVNSVTEYLKSAPPTSDEGIADLPIIPDFEVFAPVKGFRSRHRCVTLPFEALHRALTKEPLT